MKWVKTPWFVPIVLAVVLIGAGTWQIRGILQEDALSESEIKTQLEKMYNGDVQRMEAIGDVYDADISRDGAVYGATVDRITGKVLALTLKEKLPGAEEPPAETTPAPSPETPATPAQKDSVLLTEQQAIDIAMKQLNRNVPVEVDDVDFVGTSEGGYYLVQLELDIDADLDEVTYQIHAISGKAMSESWE